MANSRAPLIYNLGKELSSGGTRLHNPVLKERLMEQDLNPENFKDHLTFEW